MLDLDGLDGLAESLEPGLTWGMIALAAFIIFWITFEIRRRRAASPIDEILRRRGR